MVFVKIVAVYSFDSYREELIKTVIDNVVDPVNLAIMLRLISKPIKRNDLANWLRDRN